MLYNDDLEKNTKNLIIKSKSKFKGTKSLLKVVIGRKSFKIYFEVYNSKYDFKLHDAKITFQIVRSMIHFQI